MPEYNVIWITADERRIPVKLESKVIFGAFEAVLTDYRLAPRSG